MPISVEERLRRKGRIDAATGCVNYQPLPRPGRYGRFSLGPRTWSPHRLAWTLWVGPIPDDRWVLHHCDNSACFNIDHLYLGTSKDNARDRGIRNALWKAKHQGETHNQAKLTEKDVLFIRDLLSEGFTRRQIVEDYFPNVTYWTIRMIDTRQNWKHLP